MYEAPNICDLKAGIKMKTLYSDVLYVRPAYMYRSPKLHLVGASGMHRREGKCLLDQQIEVLGNRTVRRRSE